MFVPVEQRLETCPVVVAGKIEKVQVNDQPDRNTLRWNDTAFLKVAAVLKNDMKLPAVQEGATLKLAMSSIKNKRRMSNDLMFKEGDQGVWLLSYADESFSVGYPGDLLPLKEQQKVAEMLRNIAIEQAAVTPQVREAARQHAAARDAVPLYTMDNFNADVQRAITPKGDPDTWQVTYVHDGKGRAGAVALDRSGAVMLAGNYYFAGGFSEGLAPVGLRNGDIIKDYGFMDATGKLVIKPQYDSAEGFSEGRALVYKDGRCFYIDKTGKQISAKYKRGRAFDSGIGQVWDDESTYLIRPDGTVAYRCEARAGVWSEGLLNIGMEGFVDASGKLIIKEGIGKWPFHEGMSAFRGQDERWGFVSRDGKTWIMPRFAAIDQTTPFSEGLAAVMMDHSSGTLEKWGYIDATGKVVIEPQFVTAGPFHEGLAAVTLTTWVADPASDKPAVQRQKRGYINKEGKLVIGAWFESAGPFHHGLAQVREDVFLDSFIDRDGKYVWRTQFPGSPDKPAK